MRSLTLAIASAYQSACMAEIEALKPGNVHIFSDGHGMVVQDFIKSAESSSKIVASPGLSLGERIFRSFEATWSAVGCNTNLGIILLCSPLIQAAYLQSDLTLDARLKIVLDNTSQTDAQWVFDTIKLANPAGLGNSDVHDVHHAAACTLMEAMQVASDKDTIALQYHHYYHQLFSEGLPYYQRVLARWENPAWAATSLYLYWLANYPDSHISRKYSNHLAIQVSALAQVYETTLIKLENPKHYFRTLLEFDADLKRQGINPGTSADLTVATIFLYTLQQLPINKN